jgi:uncharacterized protein with gpF-like domain
MIVKAIDSIVKGYMHATDVITAMDSMHIRAALDKYADLIQPWARSVARYIITDIARRNEKQWFENSKEMGRALRAELQQAPTGMLLSALQADQVELITSLPKTAANRVHALTEQALIDSRRASDITKDILKTGHVTEARARLIARTEVSRAQCNLTQARGLTGLHMAHVEGRRCARHARCHGRRLRAVGHPTEDGQKRRPLPRGLRPELQVLG